MIIHGSVLRIREKAIALHTCRSVMEQNSQAKHTTYHKHVTAVLFPTLSQYVTKDFQTKRFISNVNVTGTCATTPWHTLLFTERK